MKAITTKYHGPTTHRPARLIAMDSDRNTATSSVPIESHNMDRHALAAQALCKKMGWNGELIGVELSADAWVWQWLGTSVQRIRIEDGGLHILSLADIQ